MTDPPSPDPIDRLLREHFLQQESALDPKPLFARIVESESVQPVNQDRARGRGLWVVLRRRPWSVGLSAASVIVLAYFIVLSMTPVGASANSLMLEARRVHEQLVERGYVVHVRKHPHSESELEPMEGAGKITVWTQGDRFWVEVSDAPSHWAWGRDREGTVWIALSRRRGVRIEADEMGSPLGRICQIYGLQLDSLLGELLRFHRLEELPPETHDGSIRTIRATPRNGRWNAVLREALVDIDMETKTIQRLTLTRRLAHQGFATTTFTLESTRRVDESRYHLEGHLVEPFEVFDRKHAPQRRGELLRRWFQTNPERWLQSTPRGDDSKSVDQPLGVG